MTLITLLYATQGTRWSENNLTEAIHQCFFLLIAWWMDARFSIQ